MLSPWPASPTRFIPSFQSPEPISGRPWLPTARLRSRARAQCSYSEQCSSETVGRKYDSSSSAWRTGPSRKGTVSSRTARSLVTSKTKDWIEHGADSIGERLAVDYRDRRANDAPAPKETCAVRLELYSARGLTFDDREMRSPDLGVGGRARPSRGQ